jgi:hypothetical protein
MVKKQDSQKIAHPYMDLNQENLQKQPTIIIEQISMIIVGRNRQN